jgi:hypothetical protein
MDFEKKYNGKDILVIGGGTSTNEVNWERIITPDTYIWTCNDFYRNKRVSAQTVDLYQLSYTTDISDSRLISYLNKTQPFTYYESSHYRGKQNTDEYIKFANSVNYNIYKMDIDIGQIQYTLAQKSGAVLRLLCLALVTGAKNIYFVGYDGFDKDFTNVHAFTGTKGLKDTDTRRDWEKDYYNVFMEAYIILGKIDTENRLQNLGEGLEYNLGTEASKKYFPLRKEIYEKIR